MVGGASTHHSLQPRLWTHSTAPHTIAHVGEGLRVPARGHHGRASERTGATFVNGIEPGIHRVDRTFGSVPAGRPPSRQPAPGALPGPRDRSRGELGPRRAARDRRRDLLGLPGRQRSRSRRQRHRGLRPDRPRGRRPVPVGDGRRPEGAAAGSGPGDDRAPRGDRRDGGRRSPSRGPVRRPCRGRGGSARGRDRRRAERPGQVDARPRARSARSCAPVRRARAARSDGRAGPRLPAGRPRPAGHDPAHPGAGRPREPTRATSSVVAASGP